MRGWRSEPAGGARGGWAGKLSWAYVRTCILRDDKQGGTYDDDCCQHQAKGSTSSCSSPWPCDQSGQYVYHTWPFPVLACVWEFPSQENTVGPARPCISIDDAYAFVLFLVYTHVLDHELHHPFNNTIIATRRTTLLIDHLDRIPQRTVFTSTVPVSLPLLDDRHISLCCVIMYSFYSKIVLSCSGFLLSRRKAITIDSLE
jgi:hypothetical protein